MSQKYGKVRAGDHHLGSVKCFVGTTDVTRVCFEADDVKGYAKCYDWVGIGPPPVEGQPLRIIFDGNGKPRPITYRGDVRLEVTPR